MYPQPENQPCPPTLAAYMTQMAGLDPGADYRRLPLAQLETVALSMVKASRAAHVLGCRDAAVALAKHWGADEAAAARAALLHDVTKALEPSGQLTLCGEYGILVDAFSKDNPKTLHAVTGALVAQRLFGEEPQVVQAIANHTTARAGMSLLDTIIYVADYMEVNRDFEGVEQLRALAFTNLDQALRLGLTMTVELLKRQGRSVCPRSVEALAWLDEKDSKKGHCSC